MLPLKFGFIHKINTLLYNEFISGVYIQTYSEDVRGVTPAIIKY